MEGTVLFLGTVFFIFNIGMLLVGIWEVHRIGRTQDLDTIGPIPMGWKNWNARRVATIAIMIALAIVASLVPIPSPSGTIALDMSPAYFTALYAGPINGLIMGFIGHMVVAMRTGFPLTVPVHIGIGLTAAGVASALWYFQRKLFPKNPDLGLILAVCIAILGNTFGTDILLTYVFFGIGMTMATVLPIFVASVAAVIVAAVVWRAIKGYRTTMR